MTYRELLDSLKELNQEQLNQDVTIYSYLQDEYYPALDLTFALKDDVLDDNHPIITH